MRLKPILLFVFLALLSTAGVAVAHGTQIEYTIGMAVQIQAAYDNGEPMADGQVTVYAPDDPTTPWLTGFCDDEGRFAFTPDPDKPGTWDVQVRQAGHGDIVHIPIGEGAATPVGGGFTTSQVILMIACVGWGFVGTALFFSRKRTVSSQESEA